MFIGDYLKAHSFIQPQHSTTNITVSTRLSRLVIVVHSVTDVKRKSLFRSILMIIIIAMIMITMIMITMIIAGMIMMIMRMKVMIMKTSTPIAIRMILVMIQMPTTILMVMIK